METRNQSRLASGLAFIVGIWTLLSPIWIGMSSDAAASVIVTGIIIVAASAVQYFWKNVIPSWIMGIAAVWLFLSAILYGVSAAAAWSQILSALAVAILAFWDGAEVSELQSGGEHHRPTAA